LELALACDLILASDKAVFGLPEVGLGILPGFGGTQRLARLVGPQFAKWLVLTTERVDAAKAKELGLVLDVVPAADLLPRAKAIAAKTAEQGPVAIALAKQALAKALDVDLASGLAFEAELAALSFGTADQKEAMAAFLEKRKPRFEGR
jgi:enoyl-CoA hydratase